MIFLATGGNSIHTACLFAQVIGTMQEVMLLKGIVSL